MNIKHLNNLWIGLAFVTASVLILPSSAYAQSEDDRPLKIGYVNASEVVSNAPQGKIALQELNEQFSVREEELTEMERQLQEIDQKLRNSTGLTESEITGLRGEARSLTRELERSRADLNEDYNFDRNRRLEELQALISGVILTMAQEEGFDLIVQSPVVWASPRIDITGVILERLEEISQQ